ncbi:DUF402 domain-containing protein [Saccharomonospora xinjiangensis]|uniref:DUF402 domain-containing protein n=1 Tax=Saccharomonospora xinjiangensis TaxID=75294 RepID=UPI00106FC9B5|nr:DUF402 domain-containing protein [Saccharomonospora xinjiangensis]QBQ61227.1 hypothetical protein EYD13_14390 [Saccharomonospora xinjiangensis]
MGTHPPKRERFDLSRGVNVDPKGIARAVEEFRVEDFGLYLARPTPGRVQFHYLESWVLPGLGLRITDFWFNPGHELDQDFYIDVVSVDVHDTEWITTDLYLDLTVRAGERVEVLDTDELLDAVVSGFISRDTATDTLERTYRTVEALTTHDYDLPRWLWSIGVLTTWRRHPPIG